MYKDKFEDLATKKRDKFEGLVYNIAFEAIHVLGHSLWFPQVNRIPGLSFYHVSI